MFLNIKLQRLCKSHHLQCITSSKDSEKLEKSLRVRDKDKYLSWMPMVFGPLDDTASLIDMILSLTLLNGPRNTSRNHCRLTQSICRCQLKLYHAKKKAIYKHGSEAPSCLVSQASFKTTVSKWKSVLWSGESKLEILVGNHRHRVYMSASLMVWGCINAYSMGSLHVLEGTTNAKRYIKVLEQHMLPSRWRVFQQDNAKPHTAAITTAWLRSRIVQVLNWPACSTDLSPTENIWRIIKRKIHQRWPQTLQQLETCIRQEWDKIPTPKLQKLIISTPRYLQTVFKKRRCNTMVNMPPVPTMLRPVAGIKFEMNSFCAYICKISQLKHLLCYLCSIVNKILAHVIWKSFQFSFY